MSMNEKRLLAILGSPHTNGITATMLNYAIRRAEEMGYTVTEINLYEKNPGLLPPCLSFALMNRKYNKLLSFWKKQIYNKAEINRNLLLCAAMIWC